MKMKRTVGALEGKKKHEKAPGRDPYHSLVGTRVAGTARG